MAVKPIPEGYHTITPYISVDGASGLLEFLKSAFNAEVKVHMPMPDGKVGHAEVRIGNSMLMLGDLHPECEEATGHLCLYVDDCDTVYKRAIQAGATSTMEPKDEFYGDRASKVKDKWGNAWSIHTHVRDVSAEEMNAAMAAMGQQG